MLLDRPARIVFVAAGVARERVNRRCARMSTTVPTARCSQPG